MAYWASPARDTQEGVWGTSLRKRASAYSAYLQHLMPNRESEAHIDSSKTDAGFNCVAGWIALLTASSSDPLLPSCEEEGEVQKVRQLRVPGFGAIHRWPLGISDKYAKGILAFTGG